MSGGKSLEKLRELNFQMTVKDMSSLDIGDQLIIQTVAMIDEIAKVTNRLSMRLRDWLAWGVPETRRELSDNLKLVELVSTMTQEELINDIRGRNANLPDHFGVKLSPTDWKTIQSNAVVLLSLFSQKDDLEKSLESTMSSVAPNIQAVAGTLIGAKLIAIAGSLKRLAQFPASTVQLLGAEKALFRHLTTGARCPKHGVILQHPLLATAKRQSRGRVARVIADKTALASKVDFFKGEFIGDKLREQMEAKIK